MNSRAGLLTREGLLQGAEGRAEELVSSPARDAELSSGVSAK